MILEILVCTFNDRIGRVSGIFLPPMPDVRYLVSFQYSDEKFKEAARSAVPHRSDIRLTCIRGRGLSANRNNAIAHATGDILLIADDDVSYEKDFFKHIIQCFQSHPHLDIGCFQAETTDHRPFRRYAGHSFDYAHQPRGTYFCSVEIAFRRRPDCPSFDERFGLGAPFLGAGEEEVFLLQAFRRGWSIRYFPFVVVRTEAVTTGRRFFTSPPLQRSKGAVLCLIHGPWNAWLRCLKYAFTHFRQSNPLRSLFEMTRGILYICR